jgi:hypothetical protein
MVIVEDQDEMSNMTTLFLIGYLSYTTVLD